MFHFSFLSSVTTATSLVTLLLLVCGTAVKGSPTFTISNASDFVNFSSSVAKGTNYLGTTVVLDADIVFIEEEYSRLNDSLF